MLSRRSFYMVVKPLGSRCNLECTYCYYRGKDDILPDSVAGRMDDKLLEEFIRQYIATQEVDTILFNWHGGEPTLLGLDFFRTVVQIQHKYAGTKRIDNDLQTNGLLLDEAWCEFLKQHRFLVGLSIDGPRHLHDLFRASRDGQPSFDQVYRAARLLHSYEIPFGAVTVVNSVNARHPEEVYRFLTEDLGCRHLQWLPCVEPKCFHATAPGHWDVAWMPTLGTDATKPGHPDSVVTDWSVSADDWGEFLCQTFHLWMKHGLGKVFVSWFESLVGQKVGDPAQICTLADMCGRSLVTMNKDGSVYSCDHFVFPEYKLGNLGDKILDLAAMVYSPRQQEFGCNKRGGLPEYCRQCKYTTLCNGECPKNRFLKTPDDQPGLNYLCSGIRRFLDYADPYLDQLAIQVNAPIIA